MSKRVCCLSARVVGVVGEIAGGEVAAVATMIGGGGGGGGAESFAATAAVARLLRQANAFEMVDAVGAARGVATLYSSLGSVAGGALHSRSRTIPSEPTQTECVRCF